MGCFGEDMQEPGYRIAYYDTQGITYLFVLSTVFSFLCNCNKEYFLKDIFCSVQ